MSEFGIDEEIEIYKEEDSENVVKFDKPKKRAFYTWDVAGESYRLKLDSAMTCRLEEKFRQNLLNVISSDGVPPLGVMLTIIQAAMIKYQHNIKLEKVQKIYDAYIEEGGSQIDLYSNVIMGIMGVSGFFTADQAEVLGNKIEEASQLI